MKDTRSFLLLLFRFTDLSHTPLDTKQILFLYYFSVKKLEIGLTIQLLIFQGGQKTSEISPPICSVLNSYLPCLCTSQIALLFSLPASSSSITYVFTNLNEIWTNVVGSGLPVPMFFLPTNEGKARVAGNSTWDQRRVCGSPTSTPLLPVITISLEAKKGKKEQGVPWLLDPLMLL